MYEEKIKKIVGLPWGEYNPYDIAYAFILTGAEFNNLVSLAQRCYPHSEFIKRVIVDEATKSDLIQGFVYKKGSSVDYLLLYFMKKGLFNKVSDDVLKAGCDYLRSVSSLPPGLLPAVIFSDRSALSAVFTAVQKNHIWDDYDLGFFQNYLLQYIDSYSAEAGCDCSVDGLSPDGKVLDHYWSEQLEFFSHISIK